MKFDGPDYKPQRDEVRLTAQFVRIFDLMSDAQPRTLAEIEGLTQDPQASISAQLRHMRKERFGSHTINKAYVGDGLYVYQLIVKRKIA